MAGVVSGFVQDVAWLMKNAALRKDVPTFSWATVVTASPLVVMLDGTTVSRRVSANAAGHCMAGDRVRVEVQGTRVTVLANPLRSGGTILYTGTTSVSFSGVSYAQTQVYLPAGMFTDQSRMVAVGNTTDYDTRFFVRTLVISPGQITIGARHMNSNEPQTTTVNVAYIVIQTP